MDRTMEPEARDRKIIEDRLDSGLSSPDAAVDFREKPLVQMSVHELNRFFAEMMLLVKHHGTEH